MNQRTMIIIENLFQQHITEIFV